MKGELINWALIAPHTKVGCGKGTQIRAPLRVSSGRNLLSHEGVPALIAFPTDTCKRCRSIFGAHGGSLCCKEMDRGRRYS